ncbi:MAG: cytidine deaminase [Bacilli bacterium]
MRKDKNNYYLDIAEVTLERGTCLRRLFGAIIVKNDEIVSSGYVGAPRGRKNCCDLNYCMREKLNIPRGERYEMCRSVHAEQNAIISAARKDMIGATLYLVGKEVATNEYVKDAMPCMFCKRFIINAGIDKVIIRDNESDYRTILVNDFVVSDDSLKGDFGY